MKYLLSLIKRFFRKKQSVAPPVTEVTQNKVIEATEMAVDSTEPKSYRQVDIIEHIKKTKPKHI